MFRSMNLLNNCTKFEKIRGKKDVKMEKKNLVES
jgi:hypothetical protein